MSWPARQIGVKPEECVSVADNIKRDIAGAKKAGIGCNIIFRSPEKKHPVEFTEENRPTMSLKISGDPEHSALMRSGPAAR